MALYSFRCRECDTVSFTQAPIGSEILTPRCSDCSLPMKRDYRADSPGVAPVWQEHFNPSTGTMISDKKQFAAQLREKSDYMSEKLGTEHRFVPVERADIPSFADVHDT